MCLSVTSPLPLIHGSVLCEVGGPFMAHDIHMLYVWLAQLSPGSLDVTGYSWMKGFLHCPIAHSALPPSAIPCFQTVTFL